ncbi:MAG: polysaccharide biosynthesis tyrosine autokinase [Caulobacteraceae bacterium]|nr:polysaccharide biosynthesis tyrosine autokinase [Caulobacteraceae bacterium]
MNAPLKLRMPTSVEPGAARWDLNEIIATFRRRSRVFYAVATVIFVTVLLITLQTTPRYTAIAKVEIDTRKHEVANIEEVVSGLPAESSAVDTEVEVLKSRSLAERVVTALNLDGDPEFNAKLRPRNPIMSALSIFGVGDGPDLRPADEARLTKNHEAVVDAVLKRLSVNRLGLTYVIDIGFQSQSPEKATTIANAFADKYLSEQLQAKYDATQQATQWLNERIAELEPQVATAEAAVQRYKAEHGLLASVGSTLTEQEISNLNDQLAQARADMAEKDARARTAQSAAQSGSNGGNLSGPLNSQTMMQLRTQQAAASAKVADLETKYGPRHPEVQRAQRELADISAQINQELSRQVSNLQSEDQVARQRVASLEGSLAGAKGALIGNNAASVELADLQRKAAAASTLYDNLLNRAKQTSTDLGNQQSDARVVSRAKIPLKPSYPDIKLNLALGLLLGLSGGLGALFLMEGLDSGLTTAADIERHFNLPQLGAVPLLGSTTDEKGPRLSPSEQIIEKPLSAFSEAFRNLRASILFSKVDSPVQVVVVTSAMPGEGKTTTTFCLGKSMAMSGAKVVVVDCDLRRRNINRLLGVEPESGLTEVLQGLAHLDDVLIEDKASGAWFLPLAKSPYNPRDLFGSQAMDRLLEELRRRFDIVLLDTAPVIPVSDTRLLAPKADVVVFLVQWRKTPRKAIEAAFAMLRSVGAEVAGIALTLVDVREQAKYGYGDPGYYYRSYKKYYAS